MSNTFVLRYYAGNGKVFVEGVKSDKTQGTYRTDYIIPVNKFDFVNQTFKEEDNYGNL